MSGLVTSDGNQGNNADLGLALYCAECNLRFADQAKLARHKEKFCVGTKYFDPQALHNALHRDEKLKTMSFQDVKVRTTEQQRAMLFVAIASAIRPLSLGLTCTGDAVVAHAARAVSPVAGAYCCRSLPQRTRVACVPLLPLALSLACAVHLTVVSRRQTDRARVLSRWLNLLSGVRAGQRGEPSG
jgi:hypothetical protein